ncbi:hypothetical protein JTB14_005429 [Gonioctena quinquepunctata]|nr:hypothetical protein JTB14_005429 [Gonioctena quinquepunctata]
MKDGLTQHAAERGEGGSLSNTRARIEEEKLAGVTILYAHLVKGVKTQKLRGQCRMLKLSPRQGLHGNNISQLKRGGDLKNGRKHRARGRGELNSGKRFTQKMWTVANFERNTGRLAQTMTTRNNGDTGVFNVYLKRGLGNGKPARAAKWKGT